MPLPGQWTIEDILALTFIRGMRYGTVKGIIEGHGCLGEFLHSRQYGELAAKLSSTGIYGYEIDTLVSHACRQIDLCQKANCRIVSLWDKDYPLYLRDIVYPPVLLFTKGTLQKAESQCISIVGTRKCTLYGKLVAEQFTECFVRNSVPVVSGMAMGIDTACHNAAIKAKGITYAVIASGVDQINPSYAEKLASRIIDSGGAIISEYKCGVPAHPGHFPQRNRIISGISKATVVIEAGRRSGASITANFAFDQQRDVFAVPGNINSEKSMGCNRLIRESKAAIALSPDDVLADAGFAIKSSPDLQQNRELFFASEDEETVYNLITSEPVHIDEIAAQCTLEMSELLVILLKLEFNGGIRQLPGKYYIKQM